MSKVDAHEYSPPTCRSIFTRHQAVRRNSHQFHSIFRYISPFPLIPACSLCAKQNTDPTGTLRPRHNGRARRRAPVARIEATNQFGIHSADSVCETNSGHVFSITGLSPILLIAAGAACLPPAEEISMCGVKYTPSARGVGGGGVPRQQCRREFCKTLSSHHSIGFCVMFAFSLLCTGVLRPLIFAWGFARDSERAGVSHSQVRITAQIILRPLNY